MSSVNKVILIGRLGADPEIRSMNNGDRVANLRLATSETWRDKSSGERKEKTEWHRVTVFNETHVRFAEAYLKKGAQVYVEGAIQTRKWTDKDGAEKYATEIVVQKFRGELVSLEKAERSDSYEAPERQGGGGSTDSFAADLGDEIPFITMWGMQ